MKVAVLGLLLAFSSMSFAGTIVYDPNLGSLPQAQGWTFFDNGFNPPPSVSGGILSHDSGASGARWWETHAASATDFNLGASISADVKVISSAYQPAGLQRAGYYLAMGDSAGRLAYVGITDTGVFLLNDLTSINSFVTMDTTSAFHNYSVRANGNVIRLFVDNSIVTSLGLGTANGGSYMNYVWFGAGTSLMRSNTLTKTVTFDAVPEPSTIIVLSIGALVASRRKKRV